MDDRINDGLLRQILDETRACHVDSSNGKCSCEEKRGWGLADYPLAMVYSPIQQFRDIYDMDTALAQGTVFKELDLPFMGARVSKGGKCCG